MNWLLEIPSSGEWYTTTLSSTVIQDIEFTLYFPYGMYAENLSGGMTEAQCAIFAQYREVGGDHWYDFNVKLHTQYEYVTTRYNNIATYTFPCKINDAFYKIITATPFGGMLDVGQYEIRFCTLAPKTVQLVNIASVSMAEADADGELRGFAYPGESLLGLKILATGQLSGDIEVTGVVERSKVKVYNERTSVWADREADRHGWAVYDMLANGHPNHPEYPDISATSSTIQPVYGCRVDKGRLDYESFRSMVLFVNGTTTASLNRKLNIVFDTFTTAWDAILRICQEGRGIIFPIGSKFYALADMAVDDVVADATTDADVTQLFSMGNIDLESFKQQWADKSKKANAIEVVFFDEDNNYERTQFVVRTSDWGTSSDLNNPLQLVLQGTTEYRQAFAQALYLLNCNELLNHIVVFESDIEALQAQVGDVIRVQHDSMTGSGGKVVDFERFASPPIVQRLTLDKTITLVSGTTYELLVQLSDGSLRMKSITGSGDYTQITWDYDTDWPTDPVQYDSWAFGEAGSSSKLFRIIDITTGGSYGRRITCLEYNVGVYKADLNSTDTVAQAAEKIANGDYSPASELSNDNVEKIAPDLAIDSVTLFNTAANLRLQEVISRNRATGEYESSIVASWGIEEGENWGEWEVSFRDVDGSDLGWQGEWEANHGTGYSIYDKVEREGFAYISMEDNNLSVPFFEGGG